MTIVIDVIHSEFQVVTDVRHSTISILWNRTWNHTKILIPSHQKTMEDKQIASNSSEQGNASVNCIRRVQAIEHSIIHFRHKYAYFYIIFVCLSKMTFLQCMSEINWRSNRNENVHNVSKVRQHRAKWSKFDANDVWIEISTKWAQNLSMSSAATGREANVCARFERPLFDQSKCRWHWWSRMVRGKCAKFSFISFLSKRIGGSVLEDLNAKWCCEFGAVCKVWKRNQILGIILFISHRMRKMIDWTFKYAHIYPCNG